MTEDKQDEGNDDVPVAMATAESLASILLEGVMIDIYSPILKKGFRFKIRPLSLREERSIDDAVSKMKDADNPSEPMNDLDKARERMRLIIQHGLIEPELDRKVIENLPSGIFYQLAKAIDDTSEFVPKNSSTSS